MNQQQHCTLTHTCSHTENSLIRPLPPCQHTHKKMNSDPRCLREGNRRPRSKKRVRRRPHLLNHGPRKSFMVGGDSVGKEENRQVSTWFPRDNQAAVRALQAPVSPSPAGEPHSSAASLGALSPELSLTTSSVVGSGAAGLDWAKNNCACLTASACCLACWSLVGS